MASLLSLASRSEAVREVTPRAFARPLRRHGAPFRTMVLPHRCVDSKLAGTTFWGHKEWETEINVLGVVKHPNLVKLVGYCTALSGTQLLLVYEYMPNKSVRDHLSAKSETPLSWTMRLKVAQDAARGLAYLHEEMHFQIIFRDFKSSNILLDDQWNAKLSDFGVARIVGAHEGLTHISTALQSTLQKGISHPRVMYGATVFFYMNLSRADAHWIGKSKD
ncbi:probable serine/threonine-protein kinase PBL19 [Tanacetum coccineum]